MDVPQTLRSAGSYLGSLLTNRWFYAGLALLLGIGLAIYLVADRVIMPAYTRHDTGIEVPNVLELPFDEARAELEKAGLRVERVQQRFNPRVARDVVVDQNPAPNLHVKPGRHVYLSINTGTTPIVTVPRVEGMSVREAQNRILAAGLQVIDTRPDPIPSPYKNTVTRQDPGPGASAEQGSGITLWYSTGLGTQAVEVPDVTGMTVAEARDELLQKRLRAVAVDSRDAETDLVQRQSRSPGSRVREGFEIRLFVSGGVEE